MTSRSLAFVLVGLGALCSFGCDESAKTQATSSATAPKPSASVAKPAATMPPAPPLPPTPTPLPELKTPEDNPMVAEKVNLGKQLFADKRLSKDGSASCMTCHLPDKGWADGQALSTKVGGAK